MSGEEMDLLTWEMIRLSVNIMRGCFGGCTFCSITEHEGRIIQSRSEDSILRDAAHPGTSDDGNGQRHPVPAWQPKVTGAKPAGGRGRGAAAALGCSRACIIAARSAEGALTSARQGRKHRRQPLGQLFDLVNDGVAVLPKMRAT